MADRRSGRKEAERLLCRVAAGVGIVRYIIHVYSSFFLLLAANKFGEDASLDCLHNIALSHVCQGEDYILFRPLVMHYHNMLHSL